MRPHPGSERGALYSKRLKEEDDAIRSQTSSDQWVVRWAGVCIFSLLVPADVLVGGAQLTSPAWWGFQCLQSSSKILRCVAPRGIRTCPEAELLFPLLPSLVSGPSLPWLASV